jgi:thioredoxin-related protein
MISRRLWQALAAGLILALAVSCVADGRRQAEANPAEHALELVVFEADGCIYCEILRREVAPVYGASAESRQAPLRFFNVSRSDERAIALADAITIAPTVVLLRDGREAGRIAGYTGPDMFLRLVSQAIGGDTASR